MSEHGMRLNLRQQLSETLGIPMRWFVRSREYLLAEGLFAKDRTGDRDITNDDIEELLFVFSCEWDCPLKAWYEMMTTEIEEF